MRPLYTRILSALLAVGMAVLLLPSMADAQSSEQRRLQAARDRLAQLSQEINAAERRATERDQELADADERLREVEAVVNEVAAALERQEGAVREAEHRLAVVEAEAQEVQDAFVERATRMFKQGASLSFEVMLNADGAQEALARSSFLRVVTHADTVTIESLAAAEVAVEAERQRLEAERQRLAEMKAEQEELLAEVERIRNSRALAAADARERVRLLESEQHDLEAEQADLEGLIRQRQEEERRRREAEARRLRQQQQAAARTSAPSRSGFAWPMCAPVTSEYGPRWGRMHRGIDQGAPTGTPIGASKAGTVIFAGWQGGYGKLTLIDHHDGVVTAYAHQSRFAVSQGAQVSQGQTIGYVGSTGNSTGPHLHFETRVNGTAVNPRQYLPGNPC